MDFSDVFPSQNTEWSPDGKHIALAVDQKLMIRSTETLQLVKLFSCLDHINTIAWSCDSKYVLCTIMKRGTVQVWSLEDEHWYCKIEEGAAGLTFARWSPDGRQIINTNDFQIRMTIWSLCNRSVAYIKNPKYPSAGCDFSNDQSMMAVAERKECKDFLSIYSVGEWELLRRFPVESRDLADIKWSRDDRVIVIWDTVLEYGLFIYSPDGRLLHQLKAYDGALGVKSVAWSPSSQFLAVGSFDQKCRILSGATWRCMGEYVHPGSITESSVIIYVERDTTQQYPSNRINDYSADIIGRSAYELSEAPLNLPCIPAISDKPNPKIGVSFCSWSPDSSFLITKNDNMPSVLWVWETVRLSLSSVIVQLAPIKAAKWNPKGDNSLALCIGNNTVYMWSPSGCLCIECPQADFKVNNMVWNPDGNSLCLFGKDSVCLSFQPDSH